MIKGWLFKRICLCLCLFLLTGGLLAGCRGREEEPEKKAEKAEEQAEPIEEEPAEEPEEEKPLIAIDPGHQGPGVDMSAQEPNAPGSEVMKMKATSGTSGAYSGIPEYQLCLDISLMLKDALEAEGYPVLLTRENNETAISNSERAVLANEAGADISIRIHANGSEDPQANGALALISSQSNPYTGSFYGESRALAESILGAYCGRTGFANQGIQENDTMTGINWSQIPVMILEMGFMTNEQDDLKMADPSFRQQMVQGIVEGIDQYYADKAAEETTADAQGQPLEELNVQIQNSLAERTALGEVWSVYTQDLQSGNYASAGQGALESASVIKLYTAATVFTDLENVTGQETYEGETGELLGRMISASDNDAANELVRRLGGGDAGAGMEKVNAFAKANGFAETHMGRLMLEENPSDDNYTSAADCGKLLAMLSGGELAGSEMILDYMKAQERTGKIPAGLPEGVSSANKTGELSDVENDAAVIYAGEKTYVLCVLSNQVTDPQAARDKIAEISGIVYQYMISL